MSDTELHDTLADLADDVDLVDMVPRVRAGARRRHRRRSILASTASAAVVAGVIAVAVVVAQGSGDVTRPAPPAPHTIPTVAPPKPLALSARVPRYVPPGAHLVSEGRGGGAGFPAAASHATYAVNHARIDFTVVDDEALKSCPHRETPKGPATNDQPCGPDTFWYYEFNSLAVGYPQAISGRTAHVTAPLNGFGLQDIEWRDGSYHYVLSSNRLNRRTGPSGVPFAQLVRMAQSVPIKPSVPSPALLPNPPSVSIGQPYRSQLHSLGRQLLAGNGASISYTGGGHGVLEIDVEPPDSSRFTGGSTITDSDTDPAKWRRQGATLTHLTINDKPATAWTGSRGGLSGLRCVIDGYTVGFLWHLNSVSAYRALAAATTVIPRQPAAG